MHKATVVTILVASAFGACGSSRPDESATARSTTAVENPSSTAAAPTTGGADELPDVGFGTRNAAQVERMRTIADDRPFFMINLMKFRDRAFYPDGGDEQLSGFEANARYSVAFQEVASRHGAEPQFAGFIDEVLIGDGQSWDMLAIAWYPSSAAFFAITSDPAFAAAEFHKEAALERSLVIVTERISAAERQGIEIPADVDASVVFARPEPATVPHPPLGDDHPIVLVHFLDYRDRAEYPDGRATDLTGREALDAYTQNTRDVAPALGVRPLAWFEVEGEFIGDGRPWEEIRLNWFPSHATFDALTGDETWAEGLEHRTAALEDTYAFVVTPLLDVLAPEGSG